jgi:hypothetical protein
MIRRQFAATLLLFALLVPITAFGQQPGAQQPAPDPSDPIVRIKDEGMNHSQVMQTLSYLSDVIGPRLTASPGMKRANNWTRETLEKWGMQNAHLEAWGPFGRGWSLKRFSAQVVDPLSIPLIAYPKAWSPATKGAITGDVVYLDAKTEADLDKYKGKLKGAIVLTQAPRELKARFAPLGTRQDEKSLLALADAIPPGGGRGGGPGFRMTPEQRATLNFNTRKLMFAQEEGAAVLADASRAGDGGTIFVQQATVPTMIPEVQPTTPAPRVNAYDKVAPKILPQIVLANEHYNRIVRMLQAGEPVKMEVNIAVEWQDTDPMGYNTIAEIPGSDPALKDEIVMLGGHMDSWHAGTGATDNGAGVAVAMEAMRIIQTLGLKPKRTIRIGLWTGEEEGLLGSAAYVKQHFGSLEAGNPGVVPPGTPNSQPAAPPKLTTLPEYDKFDCYFNLDNGTGKIRGVYMQGNEAVRPIFRQWLSAFRDRPSENLWGANTLSISNTGGTDHLSFDRIGLPGFQFIQDEIEYDTRTHHSNMDVFDRIQEDDMKRAATIMAAFVYQTAMRDEKIPRKPAPGR